MKPPRPLQHGVLALAGAIVLCVCLESLALVVYYYQTGHLFYSFRRTYDAIPEIEHRALTTVGLHPYFGPTHKQGVPFGIPESLQRTPGARRQTNNFGFVSSRDYPFIKDRPDQFVIGIFGGSVALWFCEVGAPRLVADLERHAFFAGREIVPLCFSHEGYKQPQQLLVLAYFLSTGQAFDLVVNIDGFNEVALGSVNHERGLDISMPSVVHVDPLINLVNQSTLTPEKLQTLARVAGYKERLNRLAGQLNDTRFASVHFVLDQVYRASTSRYRTELLALARLPSIASEQSLVHVTRPVAERDGETLFKDIASGWLAASRMMHDLLAARSAAYVHVLQPNQYYTTRPFGDAEASVALSNESPFTAGVVKGYPLLVEAAASSGQALNVFNGIHIFDREPSPVYIDNCCHYTLKGNDLLADFIADRILHLPGPWAAGPAR